MIQHIPDQALGIYKSSAIRRLGGPEIVDQSSDFTRDQFAAASVVTDVLPVFIPSRNEEDDLPATLLSIARTGALAVVLDNKSTDDTAAVAETMGAHVISVNDGNKMAATQAGVVFAQQELGVKDMLFTDADTLVVPAWPEAMRARLRRADEGKGSAVFANSILWHGESRLADFVLSSGKTLRAIKRQLTDGPVTPRGHNYGMRLDDEGVVASAIHGLDPELFTWDDHAIHDALRGTKANIVGSAAMSTTVLTRNDRTPSLRQRFMAENYSEDRRAVYAEEYGPNGVYVAS